MVNNPVERNGSKLAYKEQGEGQAVILLHGFCGSSAYWDALLPLLPQGRRYIVPDLRGHGRSAAPAGPYTMVAMAEDIAVLMEQLAAEKPIVLGHSLGGYVTLALAESRPELLSGFGLIHSTALPDTEQGKEGRLNGMKAIREKGIEPFVEGLVPKLFAPNHLDTMKDRVNQAIRIGCGTNPDGAIHTLDGMRTRPDRNQVLRKAQVPVLLVAGEHDQIISRERAFTAEGSHISQRLIPAVGHMSMLEAPDKLADIVREFIQR
jgi:3-oxoadipate enol-lactonase